jgi:hypothetical protein
MKHIPPNWAAQMTLTEIARVEDYLRQSEARSRKSELETAMCLWEAFIDPGESAVAQTYAAVRVRYGSIGLRHAVSQIVLPCDIGWAALSPEHDPVAFDFEYCPLFLATCVEWDYSISLHPDWFTRLRAAAALTL